jgi:hypothetical protein
VKLALTVAVSLGMLAPVPPAAAQRPVPSPVARPTTRDTTVRRPAVTTPRARGDTLRQRGDTVAASDTAAKANLVEPDSTLRRLLGLPGYDSRVYQAEALNFDAASKGVCLDRRATVASGDSLLIKSGSICSAGAGNTIRVGSDSARGNNVISLPGQKPIYSTGVAVYDVRGRRALVTEVRTSLEQSGEVLMVQGERVVMVLPPVDADSATAAAGASYYVRDGRITACTDSVPDYYFKAGEIKRTGNFVVARPAVLYIGDVPVMWIPFLFQDVRGGRHSGILAPTVGVSDIVRNSPSYRRSVEGLGYYVALSDYLDAQAFLDWRSSAGQAEQGDPGFMRYSGELRYNWLERYVNGRVAVSQTSQGSSQNTALSVDHSQEFSRNSRLNANYNYVTNTFLQRETTVNPLQVSATIRSSANYSQKVGPFAMTLGGTQTQYPGRAQIDRGFPSVTLSTSPLDLTSWLVWTPSLTYSATQNLAIDQPSNIGLFLRRGQTGTGADTVVADSSQRRNAYASSMSFGTPLTIRGYQIGNQVSISSTLNDFPQLENVTDVLTGAVTPRIYTSTFSTQLDWTPSFTLPPLGRNNLNLSPSLSLANVDPSPFRIRNHRTGGRWVQQSKRLTFGVSASPTLFGLFGGIGPYARLRHAISPTLSYSYAPPGEVSDEFLAARGATRFNRETGEAGRYLGALAQSQLAFGLSTNLEGKRRSVSDSTPEAGDKVKIVSVNFSPLSYDFERARATGRAIRGLTTESFNYNITSDLLPSFNVTVDYSLFEGSTLTDSARFKPFRNRVAANWSFSNTANPFAVFSRLFGRAVPVTQPNQDTSNPTPDARYERQIASQPVAGRSSSRAAFLPNQTQGWQASFQFSAARQRPVTGDNVIAFDPTLRCAQFRGPRLQLAFDQCVAQARANPTTENSISSGLAGSTIISYPNTTGLGTQLQFNLTEKWAASYNTNYDFELRNFATQIVSLQRDLHDWRAAFNFTQGANGAFAFSFLISLKAEPELKFDYHKATYRGAGF